MPQTAFSASVLALALLGAALMSPGRETAARGVVRPAPIPDLGTPAARQVLRLADEADCSDARNRVYLIDGRLLFWDRAGRCIDDSYGRVLFGADGAPLCHQQDGMLGRVEFCSDERYRALFERLLRDRTAPRLGLGQEHAVRTVDLGDGTNS